MARPGRPGSFGKKSGKSGKTTAPSTPLQQPNQDIKNAANQKRASLIHKATPDQLNQIRRANNAPGTFTERDLTAGDFLDFAFKGTEGLQNLQIAARRLFGDIEGPGADKPGFTNRGDGEAGRPKSRLLSSVGSEKAATRVASKGSKTGDTEKKPLKVAAVNRRTSLLTSPSSVGLGSGVGDAPVRRPAGSAVLG